MDRYIKLNNNNKCTWLGVKLNNKIDRLVNIERLI